VLLDGTFRGRTVLAPGAVRFKPCLRPSLLDSGHEVSLASSRFTMASSWSIHAHALGKTGLSMPG